MRLSTIIRLLAAVGVLSVLACTLVLAQRFLASPDRQRPAVNRLESLIPDTEISEKEIEGLKGKLVVENLPDVTPGERAFESARGLLRLGDFQAAEEKLKYVTTYYPTAPSAKEARRILGEINMDRLFSGKAYVTLRKYVVKRGDSFLKIARENETNLELIKSLNGLNDLKRLYPDDALVLMPLNLRMVVDVRQGLIELWKDGQYIKAYESSLMSMPNGSGIRTTKIAAIEASIDGKRTDASRPDYRGSDKVIVLREPQAEIRGKGDFKREGFVGAVMAEADIEELALFLRSGNPVEIRY